MMKRSKISAGVFSAALALSVVIGSAGQAATREEVAAIHVEKAAEFQYWNADSPTLKKITHFVEEAVNPGSANFIPVANRIAVFDMDGTFYCETAPIPSDRIIASDFVYTTTKMGNDTPDAHFYDRHQEKVVISGERLIDNAQSRKIFSLLKQIGKKPVLAFGNSMGDSGMFEYTLQDNPYSSAAFCVLCDDTKRELGSTAKADKNAENRPAAWLAYDFHEK